MSEFKQRKRMDRFDGMPEEEVMKKSLPDHLSHGLDIVIVSIINKLLLLLVVIFSWNLDLVMVCWKLINLSKALL